MAAALLCWPPLLVFVGAGLGALLRWGLGAAFNSPHSLLPWGTLVANLVGGFGIGIVMGALAHAAHWGWGHEAAQAWRLFAVTGFLGGLTTFSTFSAEVLSLLASGHWLEGSALAGLHLIGSLALTALGWALASWAWSNVNVGA